MRREISGFPYNVKTEDEFKIFLSDKISDKVSESLIKIYYKNGTFFCSIKSKIVSKKKAIGVSIAIALGILLGFSDKSEAIGVSLPHRSTPQINRIAQETVPEYITIPNPRLDKVKFVKPGELPLLIYFMDERFTSTPRISQLINKIRGGSSFAEAVVCFVIVVAVWQIMRVDSFIFPSPGWGLNTPGVNRPDQFQPPATCPRYPPIYDLLDPRKEPQPGSTLGGITRPSSMPHQDFVNLTKEERQALPHSEDMKITHEGRPELEVGFYQSRFKVGDHGAVHDLPYIEKANGGTKTEKTDENVLKMMQSIVDMPNRDNVQWFEDGTYQGVTNR